MTSATAGPHHRDGELSDFPATPAVRLPDYVLRDARQRGAKPALVDAVSGAALTYAELCARVPRVSARLRAHGIGKGDVLALCAPGSIDFVVTLLAAGTAGIVVTTVNPAWTDSEISRHLRQTGTRWLVGSADLLTAKLRAPARDAGIAGSFPIEALSQGEISPADDAGTDPAMPAEPVATGQTEAAAEPALLLSSSGTTGLPKIVVLSHRNLVASLCQTRLVHEVAADDVVLASLPLFHIFALQVSVNLTLLQGATLVLLPRFDPGSFLRAVQQYRVTRAELVPPMVLALASSDLVTGHDVSTLRVLTSGAAPLGGDLAQACGQRLGCRVKQMYGLTEVGGASHSALDDGPDHLDSIGPALPGVQCRVIDSASGADAAPGTPGELLIRAAGVMLGYLGNPEATAAAIDADGWLHTGDIVTVDADGWYRVIDRAKELIKYKGMSVAPAELEALLLSHPAVADVAVVRQPDEAAGEVPKAYVVRRDAISETALIGWVAERVAPYKRVRLVEFTDSIPKSPSGKILRRLLTSGQPATAAASQEPVPAPP
jgi:acyl-CoA synthetase (AMP-forming)/AMP-acid ligase II